MYQKLTIMGNIGRDPELRTTQQGDRVCNFSVAANRSWKDSQGNEQKETTWFRVSSWGPQGEAVKNYLSQGDGVLVEGRLRPDPETGSPQIYRKKDGTAGAGYDVTARRVVFLPKGSNQEEQVGPTNRSYLTGVKAGSDDYDDDIPF